MIKMRTSNTFMWLNLPQNKKLNETLGMVLLGL